LHLFTYDQPVWVPEFKTEPLCVLSGCRKRRLNQRLLNLCGLIRLVPERIQFRLCVLTYRCLHGSAPSYLAETIHPASSCATRHLRSADTSTLLVPSTRRSKLGDRAFPAAAARAWNSLPTRVRNAPTLVAFRQELKTVLFRECFPVDWHVLCSC